MTWIHNPPHTPNPSDATTDLHSSTFCVRQAHYRCMDCKYVAVYGTVQYTCKIIEHWNITNLKTHTHLTHYMIQYSTVQYSTVQPVTKSRSTAVACARKQGRNTTDLVMMQFNMPYMTSILERSEQLWRVLEQNGEM